MDNVFEGHKPRKRFGQNFLHDQNIIRRIANAVSAQAGQQILEIGPGQGALTEFLLQSGATITAVELDRDLAASLRQHFAGNACFTLVEGDALKFDLRSLQPQAASLRVVGNLPYNISTPLLFHLLSQREYIRDMHFMLQKEVVDRMAAEPGSKDYGRLSVMAQYYCQITPLFDVPPGAFFPPPKVMSAIVRLQPRPHHAVANHPETLARVVNLAFQQRRKTLRNTLKSAINENTIRAAGINPDARAETLSVTDFVNLANTLDSCESIPCPA
ncbi:MAG TPA: 16S rRNA (adenine(1518)-N(6)/adenine(1519)-N(6))-dimethyltransferase RsmA [Pseudomonadales bacterium]|nr:16S rRNA (adenine(1518)-N(6)/adenine(1519)-N(6))-dimethyltransferase RsmA [Pseudomonadales bacterium]